MQLLIILFALLPSSFHDLHLSMCSFTYNEEAKRVEAQQRIFYDDLEKALQFRLEDERFDILKPEESSLNYDSLFTAYINDHIDISINNKEIAFDLLEYEISDDAVVLYLYKSKIKKVENIKILSHVLFEIFDDQDNVISVKANGTSKSQKFSVSSKPAILEF